MNSNEKVERNREMAQYYIDGESIPELCKRYGITYYAVWSILKRYSVKMRTPNEGNRASKFFREREKRLEGKKEEAYRLYESGMAGEKIALQLEISDRLVWKYLKESDLEIRFGSTNPVSPFWLMESSEKYYILGYLFADGNVAFDGLSVTTVSNDRENLEKMVYISGGNFHIYRNRGKATFGGKLLGEYLGKYGLVPRKSNSMVFPENIPKEFMADFIRGYFDGDGHISFSFPEKKGMRSRFGFSSGSPDFLISLREVLAKNNIDGGKLRHQITEWGQVYQLTYNGIIRSVKMKNYLYYENCLCLDRKRDKFFLIQEPIKLISQSGGIYYRHKSLRLIF